MAATQEQIDTLQEYVSESSSIVFFGGAGVSTESGIPDFRSVDGLYNQQYDYPPETIISHSFFERKPEEFFDFYKEKMLPLGFEPNVTHKVLARWEREGRLAAVVTQNIDGLHQKAGSRNVFELHGTIARYHCMKCRRAYSFDDVFGGGKNATGVPKCPECGGLIKPDVTLYEESLDSDVIEGAVDAIYNADLLIIGGTSLAVYPASSFVQYFRGENSILINREATYYDRNATVISRGKIGEVLDAAVKMV